jgi:predicted dehydrogenase
LTISLAEAKKMRDAVEKSGLVFALTHNYTGYPLVRRMREMVHAGELGEIRLVHAEYPQDWLTGATETTGNKQAEWRVDPKRSGAGGALGDIGTHAYNLADYVTGLEVAELAADLTSFGAGRKLDDNAQIMLRYANGARGAIWASQVAPGNENWKDAFSVDRDPNAKTINPTMPRTISKAPAVMWRGIRVLRTADTVTTRLLYAPGRLS